MNSEDLNILLKEVTENVNSPLVRRYVSLDIQIGVQQQLIRSAEVVAAQLREECLTLEERIVDNFKERNRRRDRC